MQEIMGIQYLTEKEASKRYGYSMAWFSARRYKNLPPKAVQLEVRKKILYPLKETDEWFIKQLNKDI